MARTSRGGCRERAKGVEVDRADDTFSLDGQCAKSPGRKTRAFVCIRQAYMQRTMKQEMAMFTAGKGNVGVEANKAVVTSIRWRRAFSVTWTVCGLPHTHRAGWLRGRSMLSRRPK